MHTCTGFCGCVRICYAHGQTLCFVLITSCVRLRLCFLSMCHLCKAVILIYLLHSAHHSFRASLYIVMTVALGHSCTCVHSPLENLLPRRSLQAIMEHFMQPADHGKYKKCTSTQATHCVATVYQYRDIPVGIDSEDPLSNMHKLLRCNNCI